MKECITNKEYSFWIKNTMGIIIGDEYVIEARSMSLAYREFFSQVVRSGCELPPEVIIQVEEIIYEHMGECAEDCPCNDPKEIMEGSEEDLEEVV